MKIRVTDISWPDVSAKIWEITTGMQNALSDLFEGVSFGAGIDQLTIVIISVSSEDAENQRLCKSYNKVVKLRNPISKEQVKVIGFGIPLNSNEAEKMEVPELRKFVCGSVLGKIMNPDFKMPRAFDYRGFSTRLSTAIEIFSHSESLGRSSGGREELGME